MSSRQIVTRSGGRYRPKHNSITDRWRHPPNVATSHGRIQRQKRQIKSCSRVQFSGKMYQESSESPLTLRQPQGRTTLVTKPNRSCSKPRLQCMLTNSPATLRMINEFPTPKTPCPCYSITKTRVVRLRRGRRFSQALQQSQGTKGTVHPIFRLLPSITSLLHCTTAVAIFGS
jgi:hypothetical protein